MNLEGLENRRQALQAEVAGERDIIFRDLSTEANALIATAETESARKIGEARAQGLVIREQVQATAMSYAKGSLANVSSILANAPESKELSVAMAQLRALAADGLALLQGVAGGIAIGYMVATFGIGSLLSKINRGASNRPKRSWDYQLAAWKRLHQAAGDGKRLPMYDRTFRWREFYHPRTDGWDTLWFLNHVPLAPGIRDIMTAVAARMGFKRRLSKNEPNPVDPDSVTFPKLINGRWALGPRGWPLARWKADTYRPSKKDPRTVADLAHNRPYIAPTREMEFPLIPADGGRFIPDEYILFWGSPESVNAKDLLRVFEEERKRYWDARNPSIGRRFTPGRGELPIAWGPLAAIDATPIMLDVNYIVGTWMFAPDWGGDPSAIKTTIGKGPFKWENVLDLTPDAYRQILRDFDRYCGLEWVASQRVLDLDKPEIESAIQLAKDVRAGNGQAKDAAGALLASARAGNPSAQKQVGAMAIALNGQPTQAAEGL